MCPRVVLDNRGMMQAESKGGLLMFGATTVARFRRVTLSHIAGDYKITISGRWLGLEATDI